MKRKIIAKTVVALSLCGALLADTALSAIPARAEETDEASEAVEIPAEEDISAEADVLTVSADDISVTEEDMTPLDEIPAEEDIDSQDATKGTASVPAAISGVQVITDEDVLKAEGWTEPRLIWNYSPGVYCYDFLIKDAQGRVYAYNAYTNAAGATDYSYRSLSTASETPSIYLSALQNVTAYSGNTQAKDGKNDPIYPFMQGQTYTISIRAENRAGFEISEAEYDSGTDTDSTTYESRWENGERKYYKVITYKGAWSAAVTYKAEVSNITTPVQITGLASTSQDDNNVYFTYAQTFKNGTVRYQYSTDPTFATGRSSGSISQSGVSINKLSIGKWNLDEGQTYYIRVWYENSLGKTVEDAAGNPVYSNVASFISKPSQTQVINSTPAITGFRLVKTTSNGYSFAIANVLDDDSVNYQLEYGTDPNFADGSYDTNSYSMFLSKGNLESGRIYYVRVRTYTYGPTGIIYGQPSNQLTVQRAVSGGTIKLLEQNSNGLVIGYPTAMNNGDVLEYWVSTDSAFQNKPLATGVYTAGSSDSDRFTIPYGSIDPGQTVYIRLRSGIDLQYQDYGGFKAEDTDWGSFSNTLKVKLDVASATLGTGSVTSNAIELQFGHLGDGLCTGFELQKQNGKVWDELTKTTAGSYTDKKLKSDTEYSYRLRTYYFNPGTKKVTYGSWAYANTVTWGGNLHVVATAKSKNSAKISWNKLKGASGYEIYRLVTDSTATNFSSKTGGVEAYDKYEFLKSQKGSSYVAKKLTAGATETFMVRAFKNVKGKKYYINGFAAVDLNFDTVNIVSTQQTKNGGLKVNWNPIYSTNGYLIEKYDDIKDEWVTFKTINKAKASSATLPASPSCDTTYRIRAFRKGNPKKYTGAATVTVSPFLNAPGGVNAKAQGDGSIRVTWKAVPGASYYRVFRTADPDYTFNKDTKGYTYAGGVQVSNYVADASSKVGYRRENDDEKLTTTTLIDHRLTYEVNGIERVVNGPEPGVTYYYYVVAYKKVTATDRAVKIKDDLLIQSAASKAAKATVASDKESKALKAPKIAKASSKKGKVTISWKAVSGAESYVVYRSLKKSKGYTVIGYAENGKTAYTDAEALKGKTYYYKVKAAVKNDDGIDVVAKKFSNVKNVKVK